MKHSYDDVMQHSMLCEHTPEDVFKGIVNRDTHMILSVMTMINEETEKASNFLGSAIDILNTIEWASAEDKAMIFDATIALFDLSEFGPKSEEFLCNASMIDEIHKIKLRKKSPQ